MLIVFTRAQYKNGKFEYLNQYSNLIFFGVGYNPNLNKGKERIDMLDYFRWFKLLKNENPKLKISIWDASSYYIVNRTKQKKIPEEYLKRDPEKILNILSKELEKKKEIKENCIARKNYLQAIISFCEIDAEIISGMDISFRDDLYKKAFEYSLDFFLKIQNKEPELAKDVLPKNPTRANLLYVPLEIAESVYLFDKFEIDAKFGPKTEKSFDILISMIMNEYKNKSYKIFWCPNPPEGINTCYLADNGKSIYFNDNVDIIRKKLENETYKNWIKEIIEPFKDSKLSLEENIKKIQVNVNQKLQKI